MCDISSYPDECFVHVHTEDKDNFRVVSNEAAYIVKFANTYHWATCIDAHKIRTAKPFLKGPKAPFPRRFKIKCNNIEINTFDTYIKVKEPSQEDEEETIIEEASKEDEEESPKEKTSDS